MSRTVAPRLATQEHNDLVESQKCRYDLFKHLTTMSAAAIVLIATLMEKFIRTPRYSLFVVFSCFAFALSVLASVTTMMRISYYIGYGDSEIEKFKDGQFIERCAILCFVLGVGLLGLFAMSNLIH